MFAQESFKPHYTNMTEFGGLFGRVGYDFISNTQYSNRLSFTLQTFNGVQLKPRWALGMATGIDWYTSALIMPVTIGTRYDLIHSEKKVSIFGIFDGGYGFNWLNADATNYKTKGGFTLNTGLGLKLNLKNKTAFVMSLSYKMQKAFIEKPLFWQDLARTEDRTYNRMAFRIGISF